MRERLTIWGFRLRGSWKAIVAIALGAVALATFELRFDVIGLRDAEWVIYDQLLRTFSPKPVRSEHVAIVAIDDRTLQEMDTSQYGNWPYARTVWIPVLEQLEQAGAKAAVFDMTFDEQRADQGPDAQFGAAVAKLRMPVLTGFSLGPIMESGGTKVGWRLPKVQAQNPDPTKRGAGEIHLDPPPPKAEAKAEAKSDDKADGADDLDFEALEKAAAPPPLTAEELAKTLAFPVEARGVRLLPLCRSATVKGCGDADGPIAPIRDLLHAASGFGLVLTEEDSDGKMRGVRFARSDGRNTYASLAVAAAADVLRADRLVLEKGHVELGPRRVRVGRDGRALLDYEGTLSERYPVVSMVSVWAEGRRQELAKAGDKKAQAQWPLFDTSIFRDRVVLLAGTALGTSDQKATPFDSLSPGVARQAAELEGLLYTGFITEAPTWVSLLFALLAVSVFVSVLVVFRSWLLEMLWPFVLPLVVIPLGLTLARGKLHIMVMPSLEATGLGGIVALAYNHLFASRDRERVKARLAPFLDRKIVERVVESPDAPTLGQGEYREVTAFFSDIRGFSTFSEAYRDEPQTLMRILNRYLTAVSGVLLRHGAVLDNYIGDAVVGLFGTPADDPDHALHACLAAVEVQEEVAKLRAEFRQKGYPDVFTRIGMNSAVLFVGNFGSEQLFRYTAMGDGMNLASRLEGANKAFGTAIMIGPRTHELVKDGIAWRELDWIRVAGKHEPVAVYEVMGRAGSLTPVQERMVAHYHRALSLYREMRFADAEPVLDEALALVPEDGPSKTLRERCRKFKKHPPQRPWDGVVSLDK